MKIRRPVFIIGSEFSYNEGSPSYNRILNFKKGFEDQGFRVAIIALNRGDNPGLRSRISLFKTNNGLYRIGKWISLLFSIRSRFPGAVMFLSDLHNRYAIVFYVLRFMFGVTIIDVVEEPGAQLDEFRSNPFFRWTRPGHQYHRFRAFVRMHFYYKLYWKIFSLRVTISAELQQLVQKRAKRETLVCPIIHFNGGEKQPKHSAPIIGGDYFLHVGSNSITKDGLELLVEGYALFARGRNNPAKLVLCGRFDDKVKALLTGIIEKHDLKEQVVFPGFVDSAHLVNLITHAKALLIAKTRNNLNRYNFSTRLIDYLKSGNPVIMPNYGVFKIYFQEDICFFFKSDDPQSFAETLANVESATRENLKEIGIKARELLQTQFDAVSYCRKILLTVNLIK